MLCALEFGDLILWSLESGDSILSDSNALCFGVWTSNSSLETRYFGVWTPILWISEFGLRIRVRRLDTLEFGDSRYFGFRRYSRYFGVWRLDTFGFECAVLWISETRYFGVWSLETRYFRIRMLCALEFGLRIRVRRLDTLEFGLRYFGFRTSNSSSETRCFGVWRLSILWISEILSILWSLDSDTSDFGVWRLGTRYFGFRRLDTLEFGVWRLDTFGFECSVLWSLDFEFEFGDSILWSLETLDTLDFGDTLDTLEFGLRYFGFWSLETRYPILWISETRYFGVWTAILWIFETRYFGFRRLDTLDFGDSILWSLDSIL